MTYDQLYEHIVHYVAHPHTTILDGAFKMITHNLKWDYEKENDDD